MANLIHNAEVKDTSVTMRIESTRATCASTSMIPKTKSISSKLALRATKSANMKVLNLEKTAIVLMLPKKIRHILESTAQ